MSLEKNFNGKKILNRYFRFKTRFGPFQIDSDQKMFFEKILIFWSPIFRKNGYVTEKKFNGKNFQNRYFCFDIFDTNIFKLEFQLSH